MLAWLKKWWWAVVAALAAVLSFILGISIRKRPVIVGENPEREDAEADAKKKADAAASTRDEKQQDARDAHAADVQQFVEKQQEKTRELVEDPEDTNAYLKQTGEDVRR